MFAAAIRQVLGDGLPLPQIGFHQPVDHFANAHIHLRGHIGNHFLFKFTPDALFFQQIYHARQPNRVVKIILPAGFHFVKNCLNIRHAELKIAAHIIFVDCQLLFDILQSGKIILKERQTFVDNLQIPANKMLANPQGV